MLFSNTFRGLPPAGVDHVIDLPLGNQEPGALADACLEFAELQARRGRLMKMADWSTKLDDQELLTHAGKISAEQAKEKAEREYDRYRKVIDLEPPRWTRICKRRLRS